MNDSLRVSMNLLFVIFYQSYKLYIIYYINCRNH